MRKQHTPARSAAAGVIVFGLLKGQKSPRAGLFTSTRSDTLTQAARRQGLLTLRVPATGALSWRDKLPPGGIAPDGSLRLTAIRPEVLRQLQAIYRGDRGRRRETSSAEDPSGAPVNGAPTLPEPAAPPPADIDLGPSLLGAYGQLDRAGAWIERLQAELAEILSAIGKASEWSFLKESQWADDEAYLGGDGWVVNGWRWTFPARHRRRRVGSLSLVADIGKPGRPAVALGLPCMLVAWSSAAHDWAAEIDAGAGFWPPAAGTTRVRAERLVQWTGEAPGNGPSDMLPLREGAWFYLAPLSALASLGKLRSLIVQPPLDLLAGASIDAAFADAPEVLHFSRRKGELVMPN